jgi:hypothetical protein
MSLPDNIQWNANMYCGWSHADRSRRLSAKAGKVKEMIFPVI